MNAKHKAHQRYYVDGVQVPGVTTILGVMNKPALVPWANRLGLNGIDVKTYVDDMADIGTCCHYMIECDVKGVEPDLGDYSPNNVKLAENGFLKWLDWKAAHDFRPEVSELQLSHSAHRYGGTADIVGWIGRDTMALVDIKTSGSGIYPDMQCQAAAYYALLRHNNYPVEQAYILRVGRTDDEGFEEKRIDKLDVYFEIFLKCRQIYELKKEVGWR